MVAWARKSDGTGKDVLSTMRKMFKFADMDAKKSSLPRQEHQFETETPKRPVSEAVSELDSSASIWTQHSVSELGAEAEPSWLQAAMQKEARPQPNPLVAIELPTQRNRDAERGTQSRAELEGSRATTCLPQYERQFPALSQPPEQVHSNPRMKKAATESPSYPSSPRAQRSTHQEERRRDTSAPRVTTQTPMVHLERWPENHIFNPGRLPQQQDTPFSNITKPPPIPINTAPAPGPLLTALLYFALELPRSSPHHTGSYMRHYAHPMRLPLSTPQQLVTSVVHLRGYLTQQTTRFLSHFAASSSHSTQTKPSDNPPRLVVNFPSLFRSGRHGMEKIWGPELAWAWVDASEERFADVVVGMLRKVAERAVREGRGGMVDVVCVARKVVDGKRGYGLLMDVRRIGEESRRDPQKKTRKADEEATWKKRTRVLR
ncbi:hypothetical protein N0V82_001323 [Gnomoniopsis sp. IMI 355080]|nr:hypothetical protein N0V82_001323 [Gnomoniopsis sp. IMI 355080]